MEEEDFAEKWLSNHHDFKIIDFFSSIKKYDNYIDKDIIQVFLEVNSVAKYSMTSVMYFAINKIIDQNKIKAKINEKKIKILKKNYILGTKL